MTRLAAIILATLALGVAASEAKAGHGASKCWENGDGPVSMACHHKLSAPDSFVAWTNDSQRLYGVRFTDSNGRQFLPGPFEGCRAFARYGDIRMTMQRDCDGKDQMVIKANAGTATLHWERLR